MEGQASKRGVVYEVANGETVPNEGEKRFIGITEEGDAKQLTLQVCAVNQELLSVAKMVKSGNRVVFEAGGNSCIEHVTAGARTWLQEKNGMYVMKLWVKRPADRF